MILALLGAALAVTPNLDDPVRTGVQRPNDAAVVVGIEDYAFLPGVPYADRDARAFADFLVYTRGLPIERVKTLSGANRDQILRAVQRARAELGPGGTLWFYFAGHGATSPADGSLLLVGDDAKADGAVFADRSLALSELQGSLADGAVVVLDTCYAGATRGGAPLLEGTRFAVPVYVEPPKGISIWTAAGPGQISVAYDPAKHGLFTTFALGAMRGWADGELSGEPDGAVDLAEAQRYVQRALATVNGSGQAPVLTGPSATVLSTGRLEDGPKLDKLPRLGDGGGSGAPSQLIVVSSDGFARPFSYLGGSLYGDAQGRQIREHELRALVNGSTALAQLDRTDKQASLFTGVGGGTIAVGVLGVVVGAVVHGLQQSTYNFDRDKYSSDVAFCNQDAFFCDSVGAAPSKPSPIVTKLLPGLAIVGGGVGLVATGSIFRGKARRQLVHTANTLVVQ